MTFENLTAYAYFAGWRIVRWLPENFAYRLFGWVGVRLGKKRTPRLERLRSNLARVKPQLNAAALDTLVISAARSYMRYWCDTFRFPDWSHEKIVGSVSVSNEHLLMDAVSSGGGVIVALPHAGNWDHAGAYFCAKGVPLVTVVERLKPDALFRRFLSYREAMGMEALPLDGRVIAVLAKRLRQGKLVALVADRDLSRTGITVDFFNAPARMPAGPAVLALNTGALLLTAYVSYTSDGIHIDFRKIEMPLTGNLEEKVSKIVQDCANNFAAGIARHPQDWHMLQRIWIDGDFKERVDA